MVLKLSEDQRRALESIHGEVCTNHRGIADFRAKLLALLPTVSGAAIFLLLARSDVNESQFAAIGLFGFAVTFGLFMYDLRGIQDCVELRRRASMIEAHLGIDRVEQKHDSPFRDWPDPRVGALADEVGAGWIVYTAVLASWLYLVGRGLGISDWVLGVVLIATYLVLLLAFQRLWGDAMRGKSGRDSGQGPAPSPTLDEREHSLDVARPE